MNDARCTLPPPMQWEDFRVALADTAFSEMSEDEVMACASLLDDRPALLRRLQRKHNLSRLSERQNAANALGRAAKDGLLPEPANEWATCSVVDIRVTAAAALLQLQRRALADGIGVLTALGLPDDEARRFLAIDGSKPDALVCKLLPSTVYHLLEAMDAVPPAHARLLHDALELSARFGEVRIAFWTQAMTERGTEVALFDYADLSETLLGARAFVVYDATNPANNAEVIKRFVARFSQRCIGIDYQIGLDPFLCGSVDNGPGASGSLLRAHGITHVYSLKLGTRSSAGPDVERLRAAGVRTLIHAVFDGREPHGDAFARISGCVPGSCAIVPHVVRPPPRLPPESSAEPANQCGAGPSPVWADVQCPGLSLRGRLGIPPEATVFGRHGGMHTFDIPFVWQAVADVARACPGTVYFLFLNTAPVEGTEALGNVLHLPGPLVDGDAKSAFIRACDAMLHARSGGETFGLACAEFAVHDKPVITSRAHHDGGLARFHLDMLGDRAMLYKDHDSLVRLLLDFDRQAVAERARDGYFSKPYLVFQPRRVMSTFRKVFLCS